MMTNVNYEVVDFNGEIRWLWLNNIGMYVVDPKYENEFNNTPIK